MASRAKVLLNAERITDQESLFADNYVIDWNGRRAAMRVGVPPRSAAQWASTRLREGLVKAAVERRVAALRNEAEAMRECVVRELMAIATSRLGRYRVDDAGQPVVIGIGVDADSALAAIKRIARTRCIEPHPTRPGRLRVVHRLQVELWDKNAALSMLCAHLRILLDGSTESADSRGTAPDGVDWNCGGITLRL